MFKARIELTHEIGLLRLPVGAEGRELHRERNDLTHSMHTLVGAAGVRPLGFGQVAVFEAIGARAHSDRAVVDERARLDECTLELLFHGGRPVVVLLQPVIARAHIPAQEGTHFGLPSASAAVLERVCWPRPCLPAIALRFPSNRPSRRRRCCPLS